MRSSFKLSCIATALLACLLQAAPVYAEREVMEQVEPAEVLTTDALQGQRVIGWIEKGRILPEAATVKIKVDSGALTSSMHAVNLRRFTRQGKSWVRYDVPVRDADTGERITLKFERPVFRWVKIRGAGGQDHRPVVKMSMCIGDRVYEEQFSLRDRGDMTYPVLIGRRTIEHIGLIDVSRTFLLPLDCPPAADEEERDRQQLLKDDASLVDESELDKPEEVEEENEE
jgi:hypothetical protein